MTRPFGATSTTDEVMEGVDLAGKRIVVTGVSAGIGVETARVLADHGGQVVGTARDLAKARRATAGITGRNGGSLELAELDLASLASVRAATDALAMGPQIDLLIANAGVMATPFGRTVDGFETQFGTNHLGHFVFVNRLASKLNPGARVVSLTSAGHRFADVDLEDPGFERTEYAPFVAYGRSKTANALFAVEFDRRHKDRGVRATSVHPGGIATELSRHLSPGVLQAMLKEINEKRSQGAPAAMTKSIPQGAATTVWAGVVAPAEEVGGRYCEDCHVAELVDDGGMTRGGVRGYAIDPERAEALWAKSEEMVGERF